MSEILVNLCKRIIDTFLLQIIVVGGGSFFFSILLNEICERLINYLGQSLYKKYFYKLPKHSANFYLPAVPFNVEYITLFITSLRCTRFTMVHRIDITGNHIFNCNIKVVYCKFSRTILSDSQSFNRIVQFVNYIDIEWQHFLSRNSFSNFNCTLTMSKKNFSIKLYLL